MVPLVYLPTRNQHSQSQLRALQETGLGRRWVETCHLDAADSSVVGAHRRFQLSGARSIHWLWIISLRIAPAELRVARIVINNLLGRFGVRSLKGTLPYVAVCGTVGLALLAY